MASNKCAETEMGKDSFSRQKDIQDFKCAVNSYSGSRESPQTKRAQNQYFS